MSGKRESQFENYAQQRHVKIALHLSMLSPRWGGGGEICGQLAFDFLEEFFIKTPTLG